MLTAERPSGGRAEVAGYDVVTQRDDVRREVAEGLGDVLMLRGLYEEAAAQLEVAARLAADTTDRAEIEGKLGELAFKRGDVATAGEAVERAVRLHPLVTVVAVGAGLLVGGLLGAFLSVPLVAIVAQTANYYRVRNLEQAAATQAVSGSGASGSSP